MKRICHAGEAAYFLGIPLCALGVCLSAKSGFGVSMVVAPAYVLHCKLSLSIPGFTFGVAEYCLQGLLILLTALVVRKFKWKYLFSALTALFYGTALDLARTVFGTVVPELFGARLLYGVCGALITAASIALLLRTYLPQQGYELAVKEISDRFSFPIARVKWIYDAASLLVAVVLMLVLFRDFSLDMVGPGTLVLTLVNAPLIKLFGTLFDRIADFSPGAGRFYAFYEKRLD